MDNRYGTRGENFPDDNGINPQPDLNGPDPYLQQYEQQLEEFSRLDGDDYSGENKDLHFYTDDDMYYEDYPHNENSQGYGNYPPPNSQRQPNGQVRQNGQRPQQRPPQRPVNNNHSRNGGYAAQPQRASRQRPPQNRNQPAHNSAQRPVQRQPVKTNSNYTQKPSRQKPVKNTAPKNIKPSKSPKGKRNRVEEKKHPIRKAVRIILIILLILVLLFNILLVFYISKVNIVKSGNRDDSITPSMKSDNVKNILLIGSDTRDADKAGRTDSMIILSINSDTKEITMTSLMRDMYLPLVGYATDGTKMYDDTSADGLYYDKLNAANVYGGPELLMDTIEYNFDIELDSYVYINFYSFIDIVDSLGGIDLKISDEEADGMTAPMAEQNKYLGNKKGTDYLTSGGTLHMNGNQALAYARLRYVGNADFERTQRQRTVINKIIDTAKSSNPLTLNSFAKTSMASLTTNMSKADLYLYCYKSLFYMGYEINSLRLPDDNSYTYGEHNGQSTLDVDINACRQLIKEKIYS